MAQPASLARCISPPPIRKKSGVSTSEIEEVAWTSHKKIKGAQPVRAESKLAAIEAGRAQIENHLQHFTTYFHKVARPASGPRISLDEFQTIYSRNQDPHGHHFVIHQHDHPVSGVHYDLRLQFSETSTVSFAIPYGMPGNPNSIRPNRMAIETRVHNLRNNLVESASHATGSLLIWDTGEYEILPWKDEHQSMTDDESFSHRADCQQDETQAQNQRLVAAFRDRHIRLRLNGTRLPRGYTVSLRLPARNDRPRQPRGSLRKRRRLDPARALRRTQLDDTDSDSGADRDRDTKRSATPPGPTTCDAPAHDPAAVASEDEASEDTSIRVNNAYPGASNTIGSIHQRHWYLTLDRRRSGFQKARGDSDPGTWLDEDKTFFVHGRDVETSIVTGRNADQVMTDEGVQKFIGRKMWRAILE